MADKATPLVNNFNGGEISPRIDARSDIAKYFSGCRVIENMMPIIQGGVKRVPGTYYVNPVKIYPFYEYAYFGSLYARTGKINIANFTHDATLTTVNEDFRSLDYDPVTKRLFGMSNYGLSGGDPPHLYVIDCNTFTVEQIIHLSAYQNTPGFGLGDWENRILYAIGTTTPSSSGVNVVRINMDTLDIIDSSNYPINPYLTNNPTGMRCFDSTYIYFSTNEYGVHRVNKTTMVHGGSVQRSFFGAGTYPNVGRYMIETSQNFLYVADALWNRLYRLTITPFAFSASLIIAAEVNGFYGDSGSIDLVNRKIYLANHASATNRHAYKIDLVTFTVESTQNVTGYTGATVYNPYDNRIYFGERGQVEKFTPDPFALEDTLVLNVGSNIYCHCVAVT